VSNASRTLLFNIHTLDWDEALLELFTIPRSMMPTVKESSEVYGETKTTIFASKVPIAGIAGDQQAALFGQMCLSPGMVKNTYGTGCFMLMNIGEQSLMPSDNVLTTVAWKVNGKVNYAFEGSIFIAGAVVQWLRDGLGIIRSSAEIESLASQVPNTDGVYFVPAFTGLGAPYWNPYATGMMIGLTRGTTAAHIARAALEAIAYQTLEVLKAMEAASGTPVKELRVDGGATANNLLMQFQADVLGTKVIRPTITETTALGAAYLAGLAVGYWKDTSEIERFWKADRVFEPAMDPKDVAKGFQGWQRAVNAMLSWTKS
jgi:glycerol kinase